VEGHSSAGVYRHPWENLASCAQELQTLSPEMPFPNRSRFEHASPPEITIEAQLDSLAHIYGTLAATMNY